jgi:hypothetical protein
VLDDLVEQMESRKNIRLKQIEERATREKDRAEQDKVERQRREEIESKRKTEEDAKKKDALAAMSMNYGGLVYISQKHSMMRCLL